MKQTLDNQRGMALLLVLVVVALLSALLTELAFSTLVDLRLAETFRDSTRAAYLAKGGVRVGQIILQEDNNNSITKKYDHPSEWWGTGVVNYPVGDGVVSVQIEDLEGKLNINRLILLSGEVNTVQKERFTRLLDELNITDPDPELLVASLIDWIDSNLEEYPDGPGGAEDNYYMGLEKPYHCKNDKLDSISDLILVRGFSSEIIKELSPFITTYGPPTNNPTINVNTARPEVLYSWDNLVERRLIENILAARAEKPIVDRPELLTLMNEKAPTSFVENSTTFRVESWGRVNDGVRAMEAIIRKTDGKLLYLKVN